MTKKDFLSKIESLKIEVHDLLLCDSVPSDSALYALLQTARSCLDSALCFSDDFNRDKL